MSSIKEKLREYGITESNIGKGVGVFLVVSYSYTFLLWGACYCFRPAAAISRMFGTNKINDLIKKQNLGESFLSKASILSGKVDTARLGVAFAEMVAIKSLISPVMIPVRLWLTFEIVKYWNKSSDNRLAEREIKLQELPTVDKLIGNERELKAE